MRASPARWAAAAAVALAIGGAGATAAAQQELTLDLGGAPLVLRQVPKGSFQQGSPASEAGREPDEAPRQVTLSVDLYVGKTPVTRGQFARFVKDTGYRTESETGTSGGSGWNGSGLVQKPEYTWKNPGFSQTDEHPVVLVTFGDAQAFVQWASRKAGRRLRLPTEAEFEYAARAGTTTPWYGGATEAQALELGWFKANAPGGGTRPVGQKKANAFGLHDMAGNVYQWCSDFYAPYPPGPATDPVVLAPPGGSEPARRVLRGGSWLKDPKRGRSAARYRNTPGSRNADNGFRVVADTGAAAQLPVELPRGAQGTPGGTEAQGTGTQGSSAGAMAVGLGFLAVLILVFGGGMAVVAIVIVALVKASRRRQQGGAAPQVTTWFGPADGFWIRAHGPSAGARVRYACVINGQQITNEVVLSGSQDTFVYTGARPASVQVLHVAAPGWGASQPARQGGGRHRSSGSRGWGSSHDHAHDSSWSSSSDNGPFRGYPSAY